MEDKKNPNALTYGISPSAPASIKPVEVDKWVDTKPHGSGDPSGNS